MIGINSQIESGGQSGGNVGIGFAVPIDTASEIAQQLIDHRRGRARLRRHQRRRPDARDRRRAQPRRRARRPGAVRGPRQPRGRRRDRGGRRRGLGRRPAHPSRRRPDHGRRRRAGRRHGRRDRRGRRASSPATRSSSRCCATARSARSPSSSPSGPTRRRAELALLARRSGPVGLEAVAHRVLAHHPRLGELAQVVGAAGLGADPRAAGCRRTAGGPTIAPVVERLT